MDKEQLQKKLDEIKKSMPSKNSYPSTTQMVKNAAQSIVNNIQSVMNGNDLKVSGTDAQTRLNICKSCELFDASQERCTKCGCRMAVKTYLKAEKCPIGKW